MKLLISVCAAAVVLLCGAGIPRLSNANPPGFTPTIASATDSAETRTLRAQCNAEAGARIGAERKAFVRECVRVQRAAKRAQTTDKQLAQREKLRACSAQFRATGQAASERRSFMRSCLKA
jgi:hypothetical protein